MEDNIFNSIPEFDRLLEDTPFEGLSPEQKEIILRHFSGEEYEKLREMIRLSKHPAITQRKPLVPDPAIREKVLASAQTRERKVTATVSSFLRYRIPLYHAALAASLLLLIVFYFLLRSERSLRETVLPDTVYIDKVITQKDTVWVEKSPKATVSQNKELLKGKEVKTLRKTSTQAETPGNESERSSFYASRQLRYAIERITLLTAARQSDPISSDTLLLRLVSTVY